MDSVGAQDSGEFIGVGRGIELGAADQGDAAADESAVKIAVGIGAAIGGNEQMGVLVVRRGDGGEL